jgi:hypothetical protein
VPLLIRWNYSGRLIPAVDTIAASLFPLSASWLSAISYCSGRPIELDKLHILALAAETGFLLFKEQVPLKFKKEISAVHCKRKTFQLNSLSTPVDFRWTVPLTNSLICLNDRIFEMSKKAQNVVFTEC